MKPACLLIYMKFDLCQEYFYFTAFSFLQKLQMSRYDSVASVWLSSQSDMQTWPLHSFQQGIPVSFHLTGGRASSPYFWSPVHRTTANLCPQGFPLRHRQSFKWPAQMAASEGNTSWGAELVWQKETIQKLLNYKGDLGPQSLCCTWTRTRSFCHTGNAFILFRKMN